MSGYAVAERQIKAETEAKPDVPTPAGASTAAEPSTSLGGSTVTGASTTIGSATPATNPHQAPRPKRFYGTVVLDTTRVGRDASVIAEEVIAHLAALTGAKVRITLEVKAEIPEGVPDNVVRTVTENSRTLRFANQGFEQE
jgi:hypothetical protein